MARKIRRGWPGTDAGWSLDIKGRSSIAYFRVSHNPDGTEQKSIGDQESDYRAWTPRAGVVHEDDFTDDDRSASAYATQEREDFARLQRGIAAGRYDGRVLWFWSTSRQTRGDIPLDILAKASVEHGLVWAISGQVLNPANGGDLETAEFHHLMDKKYSRDLSAVVTRGKHGSARAGRPSSGVPYGYRRLYKRDQHGQPVMVNGRPVIDRVEPAQLDEHGNPVPGSPAAIVREIFARVEQGDSLSGIARDLAARHVPTAQHSLKCTVCGHKSGKARTCPNGHEQDPCHWTNTAVRSMAANPAYIGRRVYQAGGSRPQDRVAAVLDGVQTMWPPLVGEEQWWAVYGILTGSGRLRWRDNATGNTYLLSGTARCACCGGGLGGGNSKGRGPKYHCTLRGCIGIPAADLDAWAEDRLVSWLVLPEVHTRLWSRRDDDDDKVKAARAALAEATAALADLYDAAGKGLAGSPTLVAVTEKGLQDRIAEADTAIKSADRIPLGLLNTAGPDAADKWVALKTGNPKAARQLMAEVATIYVGPGRQGKAGRAEDRAEWYWNIGPDAGSPRQLPAAGARAERKRAWQETREAISAILRSAPATSDTSISADAGCDPGTVRKIRDDLTAAGEITEPGYRVSKSGRRYPFGTHPKWRAPVTA